MPRKKAADLNLGSWWFQAQRTGGDDGSQFTLAFLKNTRHTRIKKEDVHRLLSFCVKKQGEKCLLKFSASTATGKVGELKLDPAHYSEDKTDVLTVLDMDALEGLAFELKISLNPAEEESSDSESDSPPADDDATGSNATELRTSIPPATPKTPSSQENPSDFRKPGGHATPLSANRTPLSASRTNKTPRSTGAKGTDQMKASSAMKRKGVKMRLGGSETFQDENKQSEASPSPSAKKTKLTKGEKESAAAYTTHIQTKQYENVCLKHRLGRYDIYLKNLKPAKESNRLFWQCREVSDVHVQTLKKSYEENKVQAMNPLPFVVIVMCSAAEFWRLETKTYGPTTRIDQPANACDDCDCIIIDGNHHWYALDQIFEEQGTKMLLHEFNPSFLRISCEVYALKSSLGTISDAHVARLAADQNRLAAPKPMSWFGNVISCRKVAEAFSDIPEPKHLMVELPKLDKADIDHIYGQYLQTYRAGKEDQSNDYRVKAFALFPLADLKWLIKLDGFAKSIMHSDQAPEMITDHRMKPFLHLDQAYREKCYGDTFKALEDLQKLEALKKTKAKPSDLFLQVKRKFEEHFIKQAGTLGKQQVWLEAFGREVNCSDWEKLKTDYPFHVTVAIMMDHQKRAKRWKANKDGGIEQNAQSSVVNQIGANFIVASECTESSIAMACREHEKEFYGFDCIVTESIESGTKGKEFLDFVHNMRMESDAYNIVVLSVTDEWELSALLEGPRNYTTQKALVDYPKMDFGSDTYGLQDTTVCIYVISWSNWGEVCLANGKPRSRIFISEEHERKQSMIPDDIMKDFFNSVCGGSRWILDLLTGPKSLMVSKALPGIFTVVKIGDEDKGAEWGIELRSMTEEANFPADKQPKTPQVDFVDSSDEDENEEEKIDG